MVISSPVLITSGIPNGTVYSKRFAGNFSFKRYPFNHSITRAGSLEDNKVLYIPTACTIFLGTQTYMPLNALMIIPIGEPLCQIPSKRCPLVLTITGQHCCPLVLKCVVATSSLRICMPYKIGRAHV